MTVRELIVLLQEEDQDALVVYWPDVHESSGFELASGVDRVYVQRYDERGSEYSEMPRRRDPAPGYVMAVHVV